MSASTKSVPRARRLPLIGNAYDLFKNPIDFALQQYREKGPVFQMKVLGDEINMFAGVEANVFWAKHANEYLRSREIWEGWALNYEANFESFPLAIDGKRHMKWRKLMRRGFSVKMLEDRFDEVSALTLKNFDTYLGEEKTTSVLIFVQRLIMEQLGTMCANEIPGKYYDDFTLFIRTMLNVHIIKAWPKWVFHLPKIKKAQNNSFEFAEKLIRQHQENPDPEKPDLVDDLIVAYDSGEMDMTFNDLRMLVTGPFSAGMDTVTNTFASLLYGLAKHPEALQRVQQEVDEKFEIGKTKFENLREMRLGITAIMETLRLYPVAPYVPRVVDKAFDYEGYHFEPGQMAYVAQVVPHFMEEVFPDPYKFDIDRFLPPREEHKQQGALSPYGLGSHKCLGMLMADMQMLFTLCHVLKCYDIKLHPNQNYELQRRIVPTIGPKPSFKLKFTRRKENA